MNVLSIQIRFHGTLEEIATVLSLSSCVSDVERDDDGSFYEYMYGGWGDEEIEVSRALDSEFAGVTSHNNPAFFSSAAFEHVMSTLQKHGVAVDSYQTMQDLRDGTLTKVSPAA